MTGVKNLPDVIYCPDYNSSTVPYVTHGQFLKVLIETQKINCKIDVNAHRSW